MTTQIFQSIITRNIATKTHKCNIYPIRVGIPDLVWTKPNIWCVKLNASGLNNNTKTIPV